MSGIITIRPLTPVGIDFDRLREESQALGFNMLDRLAVHWMDGSNAFSAPGERLLGAFLGDALVGVGGLNRCPFDTHPRAGRVRHLYVSHAVRRVGVGNQLLATLARHAHNTFDYLNIRAPESAFSFYLQAGFLPMDHPHITHRLTLPFAA
ncbi:GNAT family N-acetyltransferase [Cronobacter malonaticus]|uniref:GNAT family N-acetyltransferase n=1 Tax=Cronobacter malonaticus TaxID=413503 RepID=UPI000CFA9A9D|nr:GNAT family N-acetyltransferase [Cronobacter malonaticus]MBF4661746.1 GNAT family N-acetyltransferase [Cronobacter malonaticus]MBF4836441.1 GNAT family N-acetyltransferase [Cronobacter malonaticus]MBF4846936.1 GNAT family N-acetyltransferase [Cronobacter malonaticus]MBF4849585.1 GNAT family N-acetyltransferase [Cronobacter malonaticus]MBF4863619.1 GNAT family N-acetyltransferase [Cronobacter malonaticus]